MAQKILSFFYLCSYETAISYRLGTDALRISLVQRDWVFAGRSFAKCFFWCAAIAPFGVQVQKAISVPMRTVDEKTPV